jgi:hypothetical protein
MLFRLSVWMALVTAGSLLVVGCGAPKSSQAGVRAHPSTVSSSTQKQSLPDQPASPEQIEAHAHYATGVIYAYNEDSPQALREFYEAALKDPENEALTEEVTRDFLQTDQPEKALA